MSTPNFRIASLIILAGLPAVAIAQTSSALPTLTWIPNSSVRLYQVNGDCDWTSWDLTIASASPNCKSTVSRTLSNADILGSDVPVVFENNGEMIVTFGDTIGASGFSAWSDVKNTFAWGAHDPIARSTTANASDGLLLNFFLNGNHGLEVLPPPQPNGTVVAMGTDDIPHAGVSINGTIYLGIKTGNVSGGTGNGGTGNNDQSNAYSLLATFNETSQAFTSGRTVSASPGGHFVGGSFYLAPAGLLGTPPPVSPEPIVLNFGVGQERASNIYLSITPSSEFWTGLDANGNSATRYFSGMINGQPIWSNAESDAVAVVTDPVNPSNPAADKPSVFYSQPLGLWLMMFDDHAGNLSTKGIYFTYAQQPWGPWSTPQLVFNPCRDKAFGNFMFYYYATASANDCPAAMPSGVSTVPGFSGPAGPTIGDQSVNAPNTTRGDAYAPALIGRFTVIAGNTLKLFYMMSTWNPYATVMMESDFTIATPAIPAILPAGVVPIYSTATTIQPASWASIYGSNLAASPTSWTGNFPTSLDSTSVNIDGKLAYLWFVSPGQINFQVPDDTTTGPVQVVVIAPGGIASGTVSLEPASPSWLVQEDGKHVTAIVFTPGSPGNSGGGWDVIGPARPVKAGETLVVYGVGFGPTEIRVPAGRAYTSTTENSTTNAVAVMIGGVPVPQANVTFSGLVSAGLYQLNIVMPGNIGSGDKPIVAAVAGVQTQNSILLTVQ